MSIITLLIIIIVAVGFVFGVMAWSKSRGKVEIILDNPGNYKNGDTVKGKVSVRLKKTMHAKEISLRLFAIINYETNMRRNGRNVTDFNTEGGYDSTIIVAGEGDYSAGEYPFEVQIPLSNKIPGLPESVENLKKGLDAAGELVGFSQNEGETNWCMMATLKVSGSVNLESSIININ